MWGIRGRVSLLLAHGHPHAWRYPLPVIAAEAELVEARLNAHLAHQATLTQMAFSSVPNMGVKPESTKKIAGKFSRVIKLLSGED